MKEPHVDVSVLVTLEHYPCFSYTQIKEPHVGVLVTFWWGYCVEPQVGDLAY